MRTPLTAGLSLAPLHYEDAAAATADGLWFEVHPENYMVEGGPRLAWLETLRASHPLSLHGVGMSLAADAQTSDRHLRQLVGLVRRFQPVLVSEHLAWCTSGGACYPDLLPIPRTREVLVRIASNVNRAQDMLKRRIAIENPSHYLHMDGHAYGEIDFFAELTKRTGCTLLLDVNNVFVSANNLGFDARAYLDAVPGGLVEEIHLAGHGADPALGANLLVDSHDAPVAADVWALYERLISRIGPRPTLIERDGNIPAFTHLLHERARAHHVLSAVARSAA